MSHATTADKLLIKPTAGARPASPCTHGRFIRKAHTKRPDARRVTSSTANTSLATAPDGPTQRLSQTPERDLGSRIARLSGVNVSRAPRVLRAVGQGFAVAGP